VDDVILFWNDVALDANRESQTDGKGEQTGPARASRALAIVHLAIYDAFVGVYNLTAPTPLAPYLSAPVVGAPAAGASLEAAVSAAARAALSNLFPSQRSVVASQVIISDAIYVDRSLGAADVSAGRAYGEAVASRILNVRRDDPTAERGRYMPKSDRGKHRADLDNPTQGFHGPRYGARSDCFSCTRRFKLDPPPQPGDPMYTAALKQVRYKGIAPHLMGTLPDLSGTAPPEVRRTADETLRGIFWAYDGAVGLGTPPRFYNQIVRIVAKNVPNPANGTPSTLNTPAHNARLFALVNTALADAGILAWKQKYEHDFWRPVVGIREHGPSLGPAATSGANDIDADADISWLPLGAPATNTTMKNMTPNFPAYPSGHATFGAAAFQITRRFYGESIGPPSSMADALFRTAAGDLGIVSDELNGINRDNQGTVRPRHVRSFPDGLFGMIIENGRSRVDLGVHWVFDSFAVDANDSPSLGLNVNLAARVAGVGGVPLGLAIADDIFGTGMSAMGAPGSS